MAHDEGLYAYQARLINEYGWWWVPLGTADSPNYDRTIGIQWLIALSYRLLGMSEWACRVPSIIAAFVTLLLTYKIAHQLLKPPLPGLSILILPLSYLWLKYAHLGTQDMTLLAIELMAIWLFLAIYQSAQPQGIKSFFMATMVGLGFLIKGFMIVLPVTALMPGFLWLTFRCKKIHWLGLILGFIVGWLPVIFWLYFSIDRYGIYPVNALFGKLINLGQNTWLGAGPAYYLWNIPANSFPWVFFAILGFSLIAKMLWTHFLEAEYKPWSLGEKQTLYEIEIHKKKDGTTEEKWILPGQQIPTFFVLLLYPVLLFFALTYFKTRTHYYPLQLTPFVAIHGAIAILWLGQYYRHFIKRSPWQKLGVLLSQWSLGGLGFLLILATLLIYGGRLGESLKQEVAVYLKIAPILGIGWLLFLPMAIWTKKQSSIQQNQAQWIAHIFWFLLLLLPPWLTLVQAKQMGGLTDFSGDVKTVVYQSNLKNIFADESVNFWIDDQDRQNGEHMQTELLLRLYTPHSGREQNQNVSVSLPEYTWVSPSIVIGHDDRVLTQVRQWRFIFHGDIFSLSKKT